MGKYLRQLVPLFLICDLVQPIACFNRALFEKLFNFRFPPQINNNYYHKSYSIWPKSFIFPSSLRSALTYCHYRSCFWGIWGAFVLKTMLVKFPVGCDWNTVAAAAAASIYTTQGLGGVVDRARRDIQASVTSRKLDSELQIDQPSFSPKKEEEGRKKTSRVSVSVIMCQRRLNFPHEKPDVMANC